MAHLRTQIRTAVVSALTGLATTGSRVHASRLRPTQALPCLLIETNDERIEQTIQAVQQRTLNVTVRAYAKVTATVDDTLDQIALETETALAAAGSLGGKLPGGLLLERIETDFDDTLEQPAGALVMQFTGSFFTASGSPGVLV